MNNKLLGTLAMIGAPFLCMDLLMHGNNGAGENFEHTSLSGVLSFIYISGWMCSMVGLSNLKVSGQSPSARIWLIIPLVTLSLANIWNIYEAILPGANTLLYRLLDLFWPVSNVVMFFFGIKVIVARQMQGWKRFVPFIVGLWLPFSIGLSTIAGMNYTTLIVSGLYSAISWMLLGYVVYASPGTQKLKYAPIIIH